MDDHTFNRTKKYIRLTKEERIEIVEHSNLPLNERQTLVAFIEAAGHRSSAPTHPRFEPFWQWALGDPPWPSCYQSYYWPPLDAIAFHAAITPSTARRHIRLLLHRGVLVLLHETHQWVPGFGFRGPATYILNLRMLSPRKVIPFEGTRHQQSIFKSASF
jgi:hypothetical protein